MSVRCFFLAGGQGMAPLDRGEAFATEAPRRRDRRRGDGLTRRTRRTRRGRGQPAAHSAQPRSGVMEEDEDVAGIIASANGTGRGGPGVLVCGNRGDRDHRQQGELHAEHGERDRTEVESASRVDDGERHGEPQVPDVDGRVRTGVAENPAGQSAGRSQQPGPRETAARTRPRRSSSLGRGAWPCAGTEDLSASRPGQMPRVRTGSSAGALFRGSTRIMVPASTPRATRDRPRRARRPRRSRRRWCGRRARRGPGPRTARRRRGRAG